MPLRVERLDPERHDRSGFACGEPSLDAYLKEQAGQDERRSLASVYVLVDEGEAEVLGFYALSPHAVHLTDVPQDLRRRLPSYPLVPVFLLGRLAVASELQGRGFGEHLLVDALRRCADSEIQGWAVLVDALDERAAAFYTKYGFRPLPSSPNRLLVSMATVGKLFR